MKEKSLFQFTTMLQEKVNNYFLNNYKDSFLKGCHRTEVKVRAGKKYYKIDIGDSGKFMYDTINDHLYFIKGYGVIDRAKDFGEVEAICNKGFDYDGYSLVPSGSNKTSQYGFAGPLVTIN